MFNMNYNLFLNECFDALSNKNIDVSNYNIDHICYRVQTYDDYSLLKSQLQCQNKLIAENIINGREISIFELAESIRYRNYSIKFFELPAPKSDSFYVESLEHIEFVVPDLNNFREKNSHIEFVESFIPHNTTLSLKLDGFSIKFHEMSIDDVVLLQKE